MNCIRCDHDAGHNRVIIDVVTGQEIGGFCRNCEYEEFGQSLDRFCKSSRTCAMCERDGHFGFAAYRTVVEDTGGRLVANGSYEISDQSPFFCDEHYYAVVDADPTPTRTAERIDR